MIAAVYPLGQRSSVWVDHTSRQMLSHWHFSPLLMYAFYTPTSLALSLCLFALLNHCLPFSFSLCLCVSFQHSLSLSLFHSFSLHRHSINYGDDGCIWLPEASESSTLNPKCCLELCAIETTPTHAEIATHEWEVVCMVSVSCGKRVWNMCTVLFINTKSITNWFV